MPVHRRRERFVFRDPRASVFQTTNNGDLNKTLNSSILVTQGSLAFTASMDYSEGVGRHLIPRSSQTEVAFDTDDNGDRNAAMNGCVLSGDPAPECNGVQWEALPAGYQRVLDSIASTRTEFYTRQTGTGNQVLNVCHDQFMPVWANTPKGAWYFSTKSRGRGNAIWHNCDWSRPGLNPAPASGQTSDRTGTVFSWDNRGGPTYVGGHQATAHAGTSQRTYYGGGGSSHPYTSAGPPVPYPGGYLGGNPGGYPPWYAGGSYGNGYR